MNQDIDTRITVTPSAYAYPLLIKQLLHTPRTVAADQEIVYQDRRLRYRDLFERIGRLANTLAGQGVQPGQTVAMMDWDSHRYLECFFAVPMMGAVLQTVNVRLSPEQIAYTLNHARADIVLVNAEFLALLEGIKDQLETVKQFVLINDEPTAPATTLNFAGEYETLLAAASTDYDFPDFDENTRATTFYTTGTTGLPKGVYFSHRQLVLHTLAVAAQLGSAPTQGRFHRDDVYMPITPMFHVHAWGLPYVATLLGVKQVYPGRYQPDTLVKLISDEKVSFSHCVPTILHMLLTNDSTKNVDLSGWKVIIGGSALPKGLAAAALERGIDVFAGYGMSETCPILTLAQVSASVAADDHVAQANERVRTGYPIPLVDIHTVDGDMADTARDGKSPGEIVVRAPWLTQGYLHNPDASEGLWDGGYLHTGDIGTLDAAGCLQVTDRLKDVVKTGGEWVSSLDLESIISQHPAVSESAVIGVKDDKWGERPMALVVLKPGQSATAEQIKSHVQTFADEGHISRYAIPDQVRFVESLTRTSVGKINKMALRQQFTA
ncbi:fatty acid--CoA ligase [Denitromonas ohlonensis]|uniref:Fatty acid--CoA ligase n=2 Tax=Denitromonas TaxID=139331 RepID=A0A557S9M8_9RHOO|nr:fatty acid--CoA ligase [Denitromonas ohlonensis]TVO63594.1 fatty acid--CoA ligase [Denitromonas ohlonensis]TVO74128.1 fatty acid--CoA ligase [Denitromonas ohlonensis]